jgi:hypothetical protein
MVVDQQGPRPDFQAMMVQGAEVLDRGLPPLPTPLTYEVHVPVASWKTELCATVRFLFYCRDHNGTIQPAETSFVYVVNSEGWLLLHTSHFWAANTWDPVGSPESTSYSGYYAIEGPGQSSFDNEAEPGNPAIICSGRHGPDVAEIWLVQGTITQKRSADGHFGVWTICTAKFEPFRIEAHDSAGALIGFIEESLEQWLPDPLPLGVITPTGAECSHHYGGRVQIHDIERFESRVVVKWTITLEPDPDVQLADDLEVHGFDSTDPWSLERIEQHVKLIDVLKLTVFHSRISLTDDIGTEYRWESGGGSTGHGRSRLHHTFEPGIPEDANVITVHWEDLEFPVPLH